jgi:TolB-like protein
MIGRQMARAALAVALAMCMARAENMVEVVDAAGEGMSRSEAIADALLQALARTGGMQMAGSELSQVRKAFAAVDENGREITVDTFLEETGRVVRTDVAGRISGYRIVSCDRTEDGRWRAVLEVSVPRYRDPGHDPDNRRKLAVLPFRSVRPAYPVNGRETPALELADAIQCRLVAELVQSRRFAVVDRDSGPEFDAEKRLILSGDARPGELGKIGQALGVDYLLLGVLEEFVADGFAERVAITGTQRGRADGRVRVGYRVMVMATRQIKWSGTVDVPFGAQSADGTPVMIDPAAMAEFAARAIAAEVTEAIYPIRIVGTENGQIVLNQGGIGVAAGELLEVYNLGRMNTDPYTGEELGRSEALVARIRVDRVTTKLSYASVVEGEPGGISPRSVCRRVRTAPELPPPAGREPDTVILPNGGVRLPFDR